MICFLCFLVVSIAYADDSKPFIYNEKGKKDPFVPIVAANGTLISPDVVKPVTIIVLEGVITDSDGNNLAILNGKVVKVGDLISSYTVASISFNQVELVKGDEHLVIKIKKGAS